MLGALLVIGSVRENLVRFLNHCLASSMLFLVILGCTEISRTEVFTIAGTAITLLLFGVILIETEIIQIFTGSLLDISAGGAMSLGLLLIRHQGIVSDTVL